MLFATMSVYCCRSVLRVCALCFLGLLLANATPESGQWYYFISFSMPLTLIEQYQTEAAHYGAVLVLRGITRQMSLHQFIFKRLLPLIHHSSQQIAIEINPNLFEQYQVKLVPTLVYVAHPKQNKCRQRTDHGGYRRCQPINANQYWKVSGAVSGQWAATKFRARQRQK